MLVKENPGTSGARRAAAVDRARHAAALLRDEFGVPFTFVDPANGQEIWRASEAVTAALGRGLQTLSQHLAELRADGKAHVHHAEQGRYQLLLPLFEDGRLALVA